MIDGVDEKLEASARKHDSPRAESADWARAAEARCASTGTVARVVFPTSGSAAIEWERFLPPGTGRGSPHVHLDATETFTVIGGDVRMSVYGAERQLTAGDVVVVRPRTPHRDPWNPEGGPAIVGRRVEPASRYDVACARTYLAELTQAGLDAQDQLTGLHHALVRWRTQGRTFSAGWPVVLQRSFDPVLAALARLTGRTVVE